PRRSPAARGVHDPLRRQAGDEVADRRAGRVTGGNSTPPLLATGYRPAYNSHWSRQPLFFPPSATPTALPGWRLSHARPATAPPRPVPPHRRPGVAAPRPG